MHLICAIGALLGANFKKCDQDSLNVSPAVEKMFNEHIAKHGQSFGTTEEYQFRLEQFALKEAQLAEINATNGGSFTVGHNQFSTWTDSEYKAMLGYAGPQTLDTANGENEVELDTTDLPESVDWRMKGAVNPVQNQVRCGSCWAFSATAAIEGAHFVATGDLLKLSEQQLVDCDYKSHGCEGGWQKNAFEYIETHGQELEKAYPYTGIDHSCLASSELGKVNVKSYKNVKAYSEDQLKAAIAQGPVSVTIEADTRVFQMYTGGILDSADCGTTLDHAVAAVGYGTEDGTDFYIVRNSWGSSWGEDGYIRIAAQKKGSGICGIQQVSLFPVTN